MAMIQPGCVYPLFGFTEAEKLNPYNHGKVWDQTSLELLADMYKAGRSLFEMCHRFGRKPDAVLSKLSGLGLLEKDPQANYTYFTKVACEFPSYKTSSSLPTKETTVSAKETTPTIETKIFIGGVEAGKLTDEQIFAKIYELETNVEHFEKVKAKPAKLKAHMLQLEKDIIELGKYVDGRA